ncbi:hypothetical protein PpBr36_02260 [Pyricularia pennisetigena]|uniref:hypothetical protein n=1 Tax=Pyricularia pennisetigena TaxID=1578925 RepID=UPI00114F474E|nr:hypothetical protein PpBr36_02260 [Pyricularia pennisetigena]TLS30510.1 hypothetical protein PpBr36_02260 [Pyricularia pennisetigena]
MLIIPPQKAGHLKPHLRRKTQSLRSGVIVVAIIPVNLTADVAAGVILSSFVKEVLQGWQIHARFDSQPGKQNGKNNVEFGSLHADHTSLVGDDSSGNAGELFLQRRPLKQSTDAA